MADEAELGLRLPDDVRAEEGKILFAAGTNTIKLFFALSVCGVNCGNNLM